MDEIYNGQLMNYLRREVDKLPYSIKHELRNFLRCGTKLSPNAAVDRVYLVKHGDHVHYHGLVRCGNQWYCPNCMPYKMMKYRSKIAVALDALKKRGFKAFMMTVTVPHFQEMSLIEVADILNKTWSKHGISARGNKARTDTSCGKYVNIMHKFCVECEITHHVKITEFTWGKNGWHPHFHILYWVPAAKFDSVLQYEDELRKYWRKKVETFMRRYWTEHHLHGFGADNVSIDGGDGADSIRNEGENATILGGDGGDTISNEGLRAYINGVAGNNQITNTGQYATIIGGEDNDVITNTVEDVTINGGDGNDTIRNSSQNVTISDGKGDDYIPIRREVIDSDTALFKIAGAYSNENQKGIFISKNGDKIAEMTSSSYLTGFETDSHWGADAEMAGLQFKTARGGHFTPHEILQKAYDGSHFMRNLYIDFMLGVTRMRHVRIRWSRTGIHDIVKVTMQQEAYKEHIKKKSRQTGVLEIILSFSKNEWSRICYYDRYHYCNLRVNILYLAVHDKTLLFEFLDGLGIEYSTVVPDYHDVRIKKIYSQYAA